MAEAPFPGAAQRAAELFADVSGGSWHQAHELFGAAMRAALDDEGLARAWAQVTAQAGAYRGMGEPVVSAAGGRTEVVVPLEFETGVMRGCVSLASDGLVCGLHFQFGADGGQPAGPGRLVLRCADGHFYSASQTALLWRSVHFGTTQFRPCPADGRWRTAVFVDPGQLSRAELAQAESYAI